MGYVKLSDDKTFSKVYPSWIIAYCVDTDSFFCTDQRYFFWEHNKEFPKESDAVQYFRNHISEFRKVRDKIAQSYGGIKKDDPIFLENTKEKW